MAGKELTDDELDRLERLSANGQLADRAAVALTKSALTDTCHTTSATHWVMH